MSKKEFVLKGRAETDGMSALLEDLIKCFKAGTICLSNGQEYLTLKPSECVDFVIEGQIKKGRQKLVVEMGWTESGVVETPPSFKITSEEPAPEPVEAAGAEPAPFETPGPCDFIGSVAPVEENKEKPEKKGKKESGAS